MWTILVVALLCILLAAIWRSTRRQEKWLPHQLQGATLAFTEMKFVSKRLALGAKVDRVYKTPDLGHHVLEFKTRGRPIAYRSDLIQLSVQAAVLRDLGYRVANTGWIGCINDDDSTITPVPVQLLSEVEIVDLRARYEAIRTRRVAGHMSISKRCNTCGQRKHCTQTQRQRTT